ncbi:ATPase, T2SS/T4P/T4SS family [Anthocerotibacter panamensis]|uniref:ATPase, T2SS/T4P/T4SS family n=1 Tax=Anthocerotibacter panamensis TaxID=2857077 RepID=UPI001C401AE4|nr:ATPase, T2SS/T4P/T4SS family [Anthocerotibacter panamensis]
MTATLTHQSLIAATNLEHLTAHAPAILGDPLYGPVLPVEDLKQALDKMGALDLNFWVCLNDLCWFSRGLIYPNDLKGWSVESALRNQGYGLVRSGNERRAIVYNPVRFLESAPDLDNLKCWLPTSSAMANLLVKGGNQWGTLPHQEHRGLAPGADALEHILAQIPELAGVKALPDANFFKRVSALVGQQTEYQFWSTTHRGSPFTRIHGLFFPQMFVNWVVTSKERAEEGILELKHKGGQRAVLTTNPLGARALATPLLFVPALREVFNQARDTDVGSGLQATVRVSSSQVIRPEDSQESLYLARILKIARTYGASDMKAYAIGGFLEVDLHIAGRKSITDQLGERLPLYLPDGSEGAACALMRRVFAALDGRVNGQFSLRVSQSGSLWVQDPQTKEEIKLRVELAPQGGVGKAWTLSGRFFWPEGDKLQHINSLGYSSRLKQLLIGPSPDEGYPAVAELRRGGVLITGPTNSGKNTLLEALMAEIYRRNRKHILMVQSPVERELPGVMQLQVDSSFTLEQAIASMLRLDPDILVLGEIEKRQTAINFGSIVNQGTVCYATLHQSHALGVYARFRGLFSEGGNAVDYGALSALIDNLRWIVAQALLYRICPNCSRAERVPESIRKAYGLTLQEWRVRGQGCMHPGCIRTGGEVGYLAQGRAPLTEALYLSVALREAMLNGAQLNTLLAQAIQEHQYTYLACAEELLATGQVAWADVRPFLSEYREAYQSLRE